MSQLDTAIRVATDRPSVARTRRLLAEGCTIREFDGLARHILFVADNWTAFQHKQREYLAAADAGAGRGG